MKKIFCFCNHKGGVGKTTFAACFCAAFAVVGYRVLLVDLDPQCNLTQSLFELDYEKSIYTAFQGGKIPIFKISENLDICPGSIEMARNDLQYSANFHILRNMLAKKLGQYDIIILDCPPSLGFNTICALVAATNLIITITPEILPIKGLTALNEVAQMVRSKYNRDLQISVLITKYNSRKSLAIATAEALKKQYGANLFNTKIRECVKLAQAPGLIQTIFEYDPGCNGAKDYEALTNEIIKTFNI